MTGAHTPGPWVVRTKTCVGGPAPCVDYDHGTVGGQIASLGLCVNAEVNARLIALAPEMAEAMQEFCDRVECDEVRSKRTYAKFKAILARADLSTPLPSGSIER